MPRTPHLVRQTAPGTCGPAALTMVLRTCGVEATMAAVTAACRLTDEGASAAELISVAERFGCTANAYRASASDLEAFNLPVILFWQSAHFVVLAAVTGDDALVLDPARGAQKLTRDQVAAHFRGVVISVSPSVAGRRMHSDHESRNRSS
jgi:ABC-type bacteriocin/lantibiotic exporter with double-glycine peptidase domain